VQGIIQSAGAPVKTRALSNYYLLRTIFKKWWKKTKQKNKPKAEKGGLVCFSWSRDTFSCCTVSEAPGSQVLGLYALGSAPLVPRFSVCNL
jgi:hypothetical protein